MKNAKTLYWIITSLMAAFMLLASIPDVLRLPQAVSIFGHLGYPGTPIRSQVCTRAWT